MGKYFVNIRVVLDLKRNSESRSDIPNSLDIILESFYCQVISKIWKAFDTTDKCPFHEVTKV